MIEIREDSLFDSGADALVNTVNCVGVAGKGLARAFHLRFPECYKTYKIACDVGLVRIGKIHICEHLFAPRFVLNFPTKIHWKNPSQIEWIESGLQDLKRLILENEIESMALPALGCSNGGLNWDDVFSRILAVLDDLDATIWVYPPWAKRD